MLFVNALVLALVQALTEFLPVSSSGHLLLFQTWFHIDLIDSLTFDLSLHFGTVVALIIFFRHDILRYLRAFVALCRHPNLTHDDQRTVINVVIATIPALVIGYFFEDTIEPLVRTIPVVAIALIVGGLIFFWVERWSKQQMRFEGLSMPESLLIGCAQVLAFIPGVSRSGSTIVAGMALHLKRSEAARFSFLLSIPAILAATAKHLLDLRFEVLGSDVWVLMGFGVVVSAIVGYLVIAFFLRFVAKYPLTVFAWYRIVLGILMLLFLRS